MPNLDPKTRRETAAALLNAARILERRNAKVRAGRVRQTHAIKRSSDIHANLGKKVEEGYGATYHSKGGLYPDLDESLMTVSRYALKASSLAKAIERWSDGVNDPRDDKFDKLMNELAGALNAVSYYVGVSRALGDLGYSAAASVRPVSAGKCKMQASKKR